MTMHLFWNEVDNRTGQLTSLIETKKEFTAAVPDGDYAQWITFVRRALSQSMFQDERHNGYVPTMYEAPQKPVSQPKNILWRMIAAV